MPNARRGRGEGGVVKLPSGAYRVVISLGKDRDGKRVRASVTADTKAEALALARARRDELGTSSPATERDLTVGSWTARWLVRCAGHLSPGTMRVRRNRARKGIEVHAIAGIALARLTRADVRTWLDDLEAAGRPPSERGELLKVLRMALNEAIREDVIRSSPADKVKGPKARRKEKRSLTAAQAAALLEAGRVEGLEVYLALALDSGCRPGELLALRRSDLLADGRTLDVRRSLELETGEEKPTKTEAGRRRILLAPWAVACVVSSGSPDDRLIPRDDDRWPYWTWLTPRLARAARKAGVPWATPYTLRHTMATLLLSAGVPITAIAARLGHRDASVTLRHYAHALPTDQDRAADASQSLFGTRLAHVGKT